MFVVKEQAAPMSPSAVRDAVLRQHVQLRVWLARIEAHANDLMDARGPIGALASELSGLRPWLDAHLRFEEELLFPALAEADAWAEVRIEHLTRDHAEQREHLRTIERILREPGDGRALAEHVLVLVRSLRADIDDEDEMALREGILRDDVVAIGQSDG